MDTSIGPIFLAVGVGSALLAAFFYWRNRRFMRESVATQGMVTGLVTSSGSEGGVVYHPVVQYTTQSGQMVQFQESVGSSPPRFQPGQTVPVRYIPSDPQRARIPGWFSSWFLTGFFLLFAVTFGGVGAWQFLSGSGGGGGDGDDGLPAQDPPGVVATIVPGAAGEAGTTVVVQDGSGVPATFTATCVSIRSAGQGREVRLGLGETELVFEAAPYTGPGPYQPGVNLEVSGGPFARQDLRALTGAVVFEGSGTNGVINVVGGASSVSGSWDCSDLPKP